MPSTSWMTLATCAVAIFSSVSSRAAIHPDFGSALVSQPSETNIRVRLEQTKSHTVNVTGIGLRFPGLTMKRAGVFQAIRVSWSAPASDGLSEWIVKDRDSEEPLARIRARAFEVQGDSLRMNIKPIAGNLKLSPAGARLTDIIATLDLESYVQGVLPGEMPTSWPMEALKAQAIAARSFALNRKRARVDSPYDVEAGVMDQVFLAPILEPGNDEARARSDQAVRETRGVILSQAAGKLAIAAYFHADCGGRTEDASRIWGSGTVGTGTAIDGSCPLNPLAKWRLRLTREEIAQKLRVSKRVALLDLEAQARTGSGRIERVLLSWSDGTETSMTAHEFRMQVGHERVKSTNFDVAGDSRGFEFSGQGFGHGVGMCQWGARHLALSGRRASEILHHYYPRARLKNLSMPLDRLAGTVEPNAAL